MNSRSVIRRTVLLLGLAAFGISAFIDPYIEGDYMAYPKRYFAMIVIASLAMLLYRVLSRTREFTWVFLFVQASMIPAPFFLRGEDRFLGFIVAFVVWSCFLGHLLLLYRKIYAVDGSENIAVDHNLAKRD